MDEICQYGNCEKQEDLVWCDLTGTALGLLYCVWHASELGYCCGCGEATNGLPEADGLLYCSACE